MSLGLLIFHKAVNNRRFVTKSVHINEVFQEGLNGNFSSLLNSPIVPLHPHHLAAVLQTNLWPTLQRGEVLVTLPPWSPVLLFPFVSSNCC